MLYQIFVCLKMQMCCYHPHKYLQFCNQKTHSASSIFYSLIYNGIQGKKTTYFWSHSKGTLQKRLFFVSKDCPVCRWFTKFDTKTNEYVDDTISNSDNTLHNWWPTLKLTSMHKKNKYAKEYKKAWNIPSLKCVTRLFWQILTFPNCL